MKKAVTTCLLLLMPLIGSCKEKESTRLLLLLGARSSPAFVDVQVGKKMNPAKGDSIAVFGAGELGKEKWGEVIIDWGDEQKPKFESGGVMSWAPPKAGAIKMTGDAKVPLVAYLLEVMVDGHMNPLKMKLIQKWQVEIGEFEITSP